MLETIGDANITAIIGLIGGIVLGLAARFGRFCTLGAIEDLLYGENDMRIRMWVIAIGTAITGTFILVAFGWLTPANTVFLSQNWLPLASILGGLMFGYGMAMSGNCGYGALARLGGGDLRSFVIVVSMGLAAYATVSGPLAWIRVYLFPPTQAEGTLPGIAHALQSLSGIPATTIGIAIGLIILVLAMAPARIRHSRSTMFWGIVVGLVIVSGWAGTQWVAENGFDGTQLASHTFSAPVGETMLYGMTATGRTLSFGIGSVVGVWLGAFVGSLFKGHFKWEACDDPRELRRQIFGSAIMGVGAVIALGCSIGQGLSAFSVLAFSAPVTLAAIFAGAALGLRQLIVGFAPTE
ncbi:MAG: YeeE/YedE family protein [Devosiaceae bacterium]|nr:YeeE/YedE family protein [Devosiaceae bacterium]